jgi:type IV pilus assembly protein PilN
MALFGKKKKKEAKISPGVNQKKKNSFFSSFLMGIVSRYSVQQEEIVGIEISAGSIKVAQMSDKNDNWLLEKFAYRYVEGGSEELLRSTPDIYVEQISQALQIAKITTTNAAVALPVSSAIIRVLETPNLSDEELEVAIRNDSLWENLTQLPDALDTYSIFHQIIKRHTDRNTMDILFVASKVDDVNLYADLVRRAGLNPTIVDVRCFSLRNAFEAQRNYPSMKNTRFGILEVSEVENFLLMLQESSPYVSDIYMRAQDKSLINENLQTMGTENISDEIRDVLDRFATQVRQSISDFTNQYKTDPLQTLYVVSPFPYVDGLVKELQNRLPEMELNLFSPFNDIIIPANIQEKVKAEQNPSIFTTTIGLATRKLDVFGYYKLVTGVKNVNLLPGRGALKKKKQQGVYRRLLIIPLVLVFAVSMLGYFYYTLGYLSDLRQQTINYNAIKQEHTLVIAEKNALLKKQKYLNKAIEKGNKVVSNQKESFEVLVEISKSVPKGVVLTDLIFENKDEFNLKGESLKDSGIIKLIENLNSSDLVAKATLNTMGVRDGSDKSKQTKIFDISLKINLSRNVSTEE